MRSPSAPPDHRLRLHVGRLPYVPASKTPPSGDSLTDLTGFPAPPQGLTNLAIEHWTAGATEALAGPKGGEDARFASRLAALDVCGTRDGHGLQCRCRLCHPRIVSARHAVTAIPRIAQPR